MQIEVDRDLCEANAVCCGLAPDVFEPRRRRERSSSSGNPPGATAILDVDRVAEGSSTRCPKNASKDCLRDLSADDESRSRRPNRTLDRPRSPSSPAPGPASAAPRRWRWRVPGPTSSSTTCRGRPAHVVDEIESLGGQGDPRRGRRRRARDRRRADRGRGRALRRAAHRRQQRRVHPRPDAVQHDRRGVGRGHPRAPARPLPALPQRGGLLARAVQGRRGAGVRPAGQHLVRGRPHRVGGPAQLRAAKAGIAAFTVAAARALAPLRRDARTRSARAPAPR